MLAPMFPVATLWQGRLPKVLLPSLVQGKPILPDFSPPVSFLSPSFPIRYECVGRQTTLLRA
jgi:hypothetical protein